MNQGRRSEIGVSRCKNTAAFSAHGAECEVAAGRKEEKRENEEKKTNAASPHNRARSYSSANKLQRQPSRQRDRQRTAVEGGSGGKTHYASMTDETFI